MVSYTVPIYLFLGSTERIGYDLLKVRLTDIEYTFACPFIISLVLENIKRFYIRGDNSKLSSKLI